MHVNRKKVFVVNAFLETCKHALSGIYLARKNSFNIFENAELQGKSCRICHILPKICQKYHKFSDNWD